MPIFRNAFFSFTLLLTVVLNWLPKELSVPSLLVSFMLLGAAVIWLFDDWDKDRSEV